MIYNDGVEYDAESLKVKICPVCQNEVFRPDAEYCIICGTSLYNNCEGEPDEGYNGERIYINIHKNPSNARYCEICGRPTYFFKNSILIEKKYNSFLLNDSYILLDGIKHVSLERINIKETKRIFSNSFKPVSPVIIDSVKKSLKKMFDIS